LGVWRDAAPIRENRHRGCVQPRLPLPDPFDRRAFTAREAVNAGLGRKRLRGNDLAHPFRGVFVPKSGDAFEARCAGILSRNPTAILCDSTAALLWGIPLPFRIEQQPKIHVAVTMGEAPGGRGLIGHLLEIPEGEVRDLRGLRVLSPAQTWCYLANGLSLTELVAAGDFLIRRADPIATKPELRQAVYDFVGRRGVRHLRDALELLNERSESARESHLRIILVEAGFTGLAVNFSIRTSGGYSYRADLAFPDRKLILEYQSDYHADIDRFRADMTRISRLAADGWEVMQINAEDLKDPAELAQRIRTVLRSRPHF
jgi:very-short-patch-repair endonuclease